MDLKKFVVANRKKKRKTYGAYRKVTLEFDRHH